MEGGNVFSGTTPFTYDMVPGMLKQLDKVIGIKNIPIGSGASPTKKQMGDLDVIVDQDALAKKYGAEKPAELRKALRAEFDAAGFETGQSGISVHVKLPMADHAHQADIMVVPNAEEVATYHKHDIPQDSPYKGKHKQIAMSKLANSKGMMWSGFQGLFARDPETNKKADLISSNLDDIAKKLIGDNATAKDLGSVESIIAALPADQAAWLKSEIDADPQS
jgi:hypothetical protein